MSVRTFGYGGGVQSTGALVMAAQGLIDYRTFLFCHTGEDSEDPATLEYLERYALPYAVAHEIDLLVIRHTRKRDGAQPTIREAIESGRDIIPMFFEMTRAKDPKRNGEPQRLSRTCTSDWKAAVSARWQKEHGATADQPGVHGLGISLDEYERMKNHSGFAWQVLDYPLVAMRLTRQDLMNIIERVGLPIPPKSKCRWCPFQSTQSWREMRDGRPELFRESVVLEATINARRAAKDLAPIYLTRKLIPLEQAVAGDQASFDFDDMCESGFCMT